MKYVINNITVRYDLESKKWQCVAPNGRVLEEFRKGNLQAALDWAATTTDFIKYDAPRS